MHKSAVVAGFSGLSLMLGACAGISTEQSQAAAEFVGNLAIRDSKVPNPTGRVECGEPRDHMLTDEGHPSVFRVVCRVFFDDGQTDTRFKDMNCIGDFESDPIAEKCYVWLPYYPEGVPTDEQPS